MDCPIIYKFFFIFTVLNSSLHYQLVGSVTGTTEVVVPSDAHEIIVFAMLSNAIISVNIFGDILTASYQTFRNGYYGEAAANAQIQISAKKGSVKLSLCIFNGVTATNTTNIRVYYR